MKSRCCVDDGLVWTCRPFYVEPRNIVSDDPQERISAEAAVLNSRLHYYSRLTGSSDAVLVGQLPLCCHSEERFSPIIFPGLLYANNI